MEGLSKEIFCLKDFDANINSNIVWNTSKEDRILIFKINNVKTVNAWTK